MCRATKANKGETLLGPSVRVRPSDRPSVRPSARPFYQFPSPPDNGRLSGHVGANTGLPGHVSAMCAVPTLLSLPSFRHHLAPLRHLGRGRVRSVTRARRAPPPPLKMGTTGFRGGYTGSCREVSAAEESEQQKKNTNTKCWEFANQIGAEAGDQSETS